MSKNLMLIVNPNSGKGSIQTVLYEIIDEFSNAGYLVTTFMTKAAGDAGRFAAQYGDRFDLIVCAGGDGTLSDTMAGRIGAADNVPIGYIPCGTANDMATTFNLSHDPRTAVKRILDGTPQPFDLGRFENHYLSYVHGFGAFTKVSFSTPQESKRALGHLAYVLEGIGHLNEIQSEHCAIEYDDGTIEGDFIFGAVTNSISVAGLMKLPEDDVSLSDGLFEVLLIKYPNNIGELGNTISQVLSRKYDPENVIFLHTKKIKFTFSHPVLWTRDGEDGGLWQTAEAENLPSAVSLVL